jgi:hypothetical protein
LNAPISQVAIIAQQIGSELMPDNRDYVNRFTVKSTSSSSVYLVSQRRNSEQWCCSCRGWIHYRHCKHLVDILQRLASISVSMPLDDSVLQMLNSARTAFLDLESTPLHIATPPPSRYLDL